MRISGMTTGLDVESLVRQLMELERQPLQMLETKKSDAEAKTKTWEDLNKRLKDFLEITEKLKTEKGFSEREVSLSEETIAAVTASVESQSGSLDLEIRSLATSQRVETGVFSSLHTALGLSGTIMVGDKAISISIEDTLETIQQKIALQKINATCRAVKLAEDQYKIVIMSNGLGTAAALEFLDSADAAAYAVAVSGTAVTEAEIDGDAVAGQYKIDVHSLASAQRVASDTHATPDSALGYGGSFSLNGAIINVQESDSLQAVADAINGVHTGVTASVVTTEDGVRLELQSDTSGQQGAICFSDQNGILRGLGVLTGVMGVKTEIGAAKDASYSINGVQHKSSTNDVSVIPGVSMRLGATGDASISVTAEGGVLRGLGLLSASGELAHESVKAQDAVFCVDGYVFRRSTNNVDDAVAGLNITLKKTGTTTIEISEKAEEMLSNIKTWVNKYNEIVSFIKDRSKYDLKTKTGGVLTGDSLARDLLVRLQNMAMYSVPMLDSFGSLGSIGITIGKYNSADANKLVIDEKVLKEKIDSNRMDVMKLFGAPTADAPNPTDGVAVSMWTMLDSYVHSRTGLVPRHTESLNLDVDIIQQRLDSMQTRLTRRESELYAVYSRMEIMLSRLQNQMGTINKII